MKHSYDDLPAEFLTCPDRTATGSEKWDRYAEHVTPSGETILPFWVADMDFQSPDVVLDAIGNADRFTKCIAD